MLWLLAPSVLCVYLAGLGLSVLTLKSCRRFESFCGMLAIVFSVGMIADTLLVLLVQKLVIANVLGSTLSLWGWYLGFRFRKELPRVSPQDKIALTLTAGTILLFFANLIFEPLKYWDARSVFFYAGKRAWFAKSIGQQVDWNSALHPQYPKLAAILSSQVATVVGFWNDYLPKAILIPLLLPPLLWISERATKTVSFVFLFSALFLSRGLAIWSGYLDGFLALYIVSAALFLSDYLQSGKSSLLVSMGVALSVTLNLKEEGYFTFAVFALGCAYYAWKNRSLRKDAKTLWLPLVALISPAVLWIIYRNLWGLYGQVHVVGTASFKTLWESLTDPDRMKLILSTQFWNHPALPPLYFMVLILTVLPRLLPVKIGNAWKPVFLIAVTYHLGLLLLYASGAVDNIVTHLLSVSTDRITLPIVYCLIAVVSSLLYDIENSWEKRPPKPN